MADSPSPKFHLYEEEGIAVPTGVVDASVKLIDSPSQLVVDTINLASKRGFMTTVWVFVLWHPLMLVTVTPGPAASVLITGDTAMTNFWLSVS